MWTASALCIGISGEACPHCAGGQFAFGSGNAPCATASDHAKHDSVQANPTEKPIFFMLVLLNFGWSIHRPQRADEKTKEEDRCFFSESSARARIGARRRQTTARTSSAAVNPFRARNIPEPEDEKKRPLEFGRAFAERQSLKAARVGAFGRRPNERVAKDVAIGRLSHELNPVVRHARRQVGRAFRAH